MKEQITILMAAEILNTTPLNILMHVKRGMLEGTEGEGGWMIAKASLDALVAKTGGLKSAGLCNSNCAQKNACGGGCG